MTQKENQLQDSLVVLVDLDQTIADFTGGWKKAWNAKYPDRQIVDDPTDFDLEIAYSNIASEGEVSAIYHAPGFLLGLDPLPGAIEALHQMQASGIEVFLCSSPARVTTSYSEKADWVELHLGKDWVKKLILTKDKTFVHGDYLIDDKPEIFGLFSPTWEHILLDQPYNRDEEQCKQFRITWKTWPSLLLYHVGK